MKLINNLVRCIAHPINEFLKEAYGYSVIIHWLDDGTIHKHHTWTRKEALEWFNCYPREFCVITMYGIGNEVRSINSLIQLPLN